MTGVYTTEGKRVYVVHRGEKFLVCIAESEVGAYDIAEGSRLLSERHITDEERNEVEELRVTANALEFETLFKLFDRVYPRPQEKAKEEDASKIEAEMKREPYIAPPVVKPKRVSKKNPKKNPKKSPKRLKFGRHTEKK